MSRKAVKHVCPVSTLNGHVCVYAHACVQRGVRRCWCLCTWPLDLVGSLFTVPLLCLLCPQPLLGQTGLPQGPSEQKVAVVTVDGCDTGVALRFGAVLGNYSCAAQGTQGGSKK